MRRTGNAPLSPLRDRILEKCSRLNIPVQAVLELTYRCNLCCGHCYVDGEAGNELSALEWEDIIDQLKASGTFNLLFTGGEVLLREDFLEIATYARRSGFFIGLISNLTMMTDTMARDIADLKPSSMNTSLYGASAETHDNITGVEGSYSRTIDGIRKLVACGLKPVVKTIAMKNNIDELDRIEQMVTDIGAAWQFETGIAPSKHGATYPLEYEPDDDDLAASHWYLEKLPKIDITKQYLCAAGRTRCTISPTGDVFPCVIFPLKLGDLRESRFDAIWHLEPCAELRYLRSMRRADLNVCKDCELTDYCQRCPGIAYVESGQLGGPSPSACRQARLRRRLNQAAEVIVCPKNPI